MNPCDSFFFFPQTFDSFSKGERWDPQLLLEGEFKQL